MTNSAKRTLENYKAALKSRKLTTYEPGESEYQAAQGLVEFWKELLSECLDNNEITIAEIKR